MDAATKSAARGVAEEALKLYDKGDYAGAYEKANRANNLVHAPTMALLTGRCLKKLGRFVEASEKYLEASRDPLDAGASAAQKSAQTEADKARAALMPRIPWSSSRSIRRPRTRRSRSTARPSLRRWSASSGPSIRASTASPSRAAARAPRKISR